MRKVNILKNEDCLNTFFVENINIDNCYNFDCFKNIFLCNDILKDLKNKNDIFKIEVFDSNETKLFEKNIRYYLKYNNKNYFLEDLYFYGNKYYVKQELLNKEYKNFNYNFKPDYDFFGYSKNGYFGIELEMSCGSETNFNYLYRNLIENDLLKNNRIILKDDTSIRGSYTVEIVTAPHERKELNETIYKLCNIFDNFEEQGVAKGHNSGGIHIHYSLDNLNYKHSLNLLSFFYNRNNIDFIEKVAQRANNNYCSYEINKVLTQQELIDVVINKKNKFKNKERYSALNFTENTLEFRIFNSNLRCERILKNLDFVEAIINFSKSNKFDKEYYNFESFIKKSRKYKYLKDFIKYLNEE